MALDHLIKKAVDHFNITKPEDWLKIRPEWVIQVDGVGKETLNHIRLYLSARGLTLLDDATPDFWRQNLQTARIGGKVSLVDEAETEAFTILVDTKEQKPWTFQGLSEKNKPIIQPYQFKNLGESQGDYSVAGLETWVHVERKSREDAISTFLSHGQRGEAWIRTLEFLAEIPMGCVIIEATEEDCIGSINPRGQRSAQAMANEFAGSVISWQFDYRVPFLFRRNRRFAEIWARKILKRGWRLGSQMKKERELDSQKIDSVLDILA